ncbi:hypothetical protein HK098_005792 [Nowakowskiella sp. JEL0407]|nr:hypothetical protein HK098_005792 [Nowakowskiella sp. JEL0407]
MGDNHRTNGSSVFSHQKSSAQNRIKEKLRLRENFQSFSSNFSSITSSPSTKSPVAERDDLIATSSSTQKSAPTLNLGLSIDENISTNSLGKETILQQNSNSLDSYFFTELTKDLDALYAKTSPKKSPKLGEAKSPLVGSSPKLSAYYPASSSPSPSDSSDRVGSSSGDVVERPSSRQPPIRAQTRSPELLRESSRNGMERSHSEKTLRSDEVFTGSIASHHPQVKKVASQRQRPSSVASSATHSSGKRVDKEFVVNEEIIVPDYIYKLEQTIMEDPTISPTPSQFLSTDGYEAWIHSKSNERLQETLCSLLHARYIHPSGTIQKLKTKRISHTDTASEKSVGTTNTTATLATSSSKQDQKIFFKIVKARKLFLKDGKSRDVYCTIEIGDITVVDANEKHKRRLKESFTTETVTVHSRVPLKKQASSYGGFPKLDRKSSFISNSDDEDDDDDAEHEKSEEEDSEMVFWNQHLNIPIKGVNDMIVIKVWDRKKDYFLGEVRLLVNEVKEWCEKGNDISRWYKLNPRKQVETNALGINQKRDRYVGGEIYLEAALAEEDLITTAKLISGPSLENEPEEYIRSLFLTYRVNLRELYKMLLRACLTSDMQMLTITENTEELLSLESRTILNVFGGAPKNSSADGVPIEGGVFWDVGEAFQIISYVALLFERYKSYQVPTSSLKVGYHTLRDYLKLGGSWLPDSEKPHLLELLKQMHSYYTSQVTNYKDFYPYRTQSSTNNQSTVSSPANQTAYIDALKTTLFMLRMINKEPIYRKAFPDIPDSFRDELRKMMIESAVVRFQRFQNLNAPLDESVVADVMDGFLRLADFCIEDVKLDAEFYEKAFTRYLNSEIVLFINLMQCCRELSITQLVAETYLKYFILTLESQNEVFITDEAVNQCGDLVFSLYHRVKLLEETYVSIEYILIVEFQFSYILIYSFKSLDIKINSADLEAWFIPFVRRWILHLNNKTIEWVTNAIKADNFEFIHTPMQSQQLMAISPEPNTELLAHSSCVTDLFSVIHQELDFILGLNWQNSHQILQHDTFLLAFAKTTYNAVDQFCYTVSVGEISDLQGSNPAWSRLTSLAKLSQNSEPKDIQNQTCVKLCNMEYAIVKLEELYKRMNVSSVAQSVREYRRNFSRKGAGANKIAWQQEEVVKGGLGVEIAYAEDLKPCSKNGLSNPYVVVRVPDGTIVPPQADTEGLPKSSKQKTDEPTILNGKECEIIRTRAQYDTLNPQWDEKFHTILPPIQKLEVVVSSRNMISSDQVAGRAEIPLATGPYALKSLLEDHQTHDVFVELEPQGRVLFRLTLDGEDEDVDFWFRKSRERLWRTRDDFVRGLAAKMTPYCREIILKSIKVHEAAPLVQRTIFQSVADRMGYNSQKKDPIADQQPIPLSAFTYAGISIEQPVTANEADILLSPLTDYLNKNLETLCMSLSRTMAHEVIKRIWEDVLGYIDIALAPPLYGQIERDRRFLNSRQVTMVDWMLRILQDFFHADGQGFGLSMELLRDNKKFKNIYLLLGGYHDPEIRRLMKEYETSLVLSTSKSETGGEKSTNDVKESSEKVEEKVWLLRLLRLRIEKQEEISVDDRDAYKTWVYFMLERRRR